MSVGNQDQEVLIKQLVIYPLKSCGALQVSQFVLGESGPLLRFGNLQMGDREWMIVNSQDGVMLTQRKFPKMALLRPLIDGRKLFLQIQGQVFEVPFQDSLKRTTVEVFGAPINAALVGNKDLDQALSQYLGAGVQLVHFDGKSQREALKKGQSVGVQTRFTDASPYLLISEESVGDLNSRMNHQIGPERFRANIIVSNPKPYGEDEWHQLKVRNLVLESSKACSRCVVITIDPETGVAPNNEPLRALAQYRKNGDKVYFGQYFISKTFGKTLRVGDRLALA